MNRKKRIVLWSWITIIILMILFPPALKNKYSGAHYRRQSALKSMGGNPTSTPQELIPDGYGFLFSMGSKNINIGILAGQLIIVSVLAGGMFVTIKSKGDSRGPEVSEQE